MRLLRKLKHRNVRRVFPTIVSIVLILILVSYAPMNEVHVAFERFNFKFAFVLLGLSALYYGLKTMRYWYLLQAMNIHKPLEPVAVSYMSAQPMTLIPGGEIYRSHALRKYTGVPIRDSFTQFTVQGFLEGIALATVAVISALALHRLQAPTIIISLGLIVLTILIARGYIKPVGRQLNKLPFVNVAHETYDTLDTHQRAILTRRWLPFLFCMSLLVELTGATIAYVAAISVGANINGFEAVFLYAIPLVASFLSLVPGGIGVGEQAAVGVLLLSGVVLGNAIAAALIMRISIVGLGFIYGVTTSAIGHLQLAKMQAVQASNEARF